MQNATMVRAGGPLLAGAEALGHADTRIVSKHYAHLAPLYVAETVRRTAPDLALPNDSKVVSWVAKWDPDNLCKSRDDIPLGLFSVSSLFYFRSHGSDLRHRMDQRHLEPCNRVHQDQRWLRFLLR
ncbi:hypothetical protein C4E04_01485 [Microvirga sp. 17 mud 1-3]|nr:hypothetical protein C4E04_01485 [Microvirga sp. 17 mud 1-3]